MFQQEDAGCFVANGCDVSVVVSNILEQDHRSAKQNGS
jgi:hypothetical protein